VCEATVIKVQTPRSFDRTAVVTIAIPKGLAHEVRSIRRGGASGEEGVR